MARLARDEHFAPDEVAIVRVMNRTVTRCFWTLRAEPQVAFLFLLR